INRFIEKVTQTNYVDAGHVNGYRKEGERTLERSRLRRIKRACDKREITPFGPTRAIPLVEEYAATLIDKGTGTGMDVWPPTPRPQSRLLPDTYDAGMLLELV
ncbi:unnamed protein product, partial [Ascophyllum nodosum]